MITMFNRRELIAVSSLQEYSCIRRLLMAEGIRNRTKMGKGIGGAAAESYAIYVHERDYDRAAAAIRPALSGEEREARK